MTKETEFNPMAAENPRAVAGDNQPPRTKADVFKDILDLYEEASHWADGTDIESAEQHDAVTLIRTTMHELGKEADDMRAAEKKPHDDAAKKVQAEFNPYVQKDKGKVDKAKSCLDAVLGRWRVREAKRKQEIADAQRREAEEEKRRATEAMRESSGNLAARDEAEALLERAKETDRFARRAERQATTGTGLRTVRSIELPEANRGEGMDWAFEHDPEAFYRLSVDLAASYHNATRRVAPGFVLNERQVAR